MASAGGFGKGQVEGIMGRLTNSLSEIADAFEHAVAPIAKFVDALSPGTMHVFNTAMRDLNATIGVAFIPVVQVLTETVKKAAALLVPTVNALAPAFQTLAGALSSFITPAIQSMAKGLREMAPVLQNIGNVLHTLGDGLAVLSALFLAGADAVKGFIGGLLGGGGPDGMKGIFDKLVRAIQQVTLAFISAAAYIAKAFGNTTFIEAFKKNLAELAKPGEGGVGGALQGASLKNFEQISKDIAIAAAQAGAGGEPDKRLEDFAKDAVETLDDILKNGKTLNDFLDGLWKDISTKLDNMTDKLTDSIKNMFVPSFLR